MPTCTIITTAPNGLLRPIHDRTPMNVRPEHYGRWVDPETPLADAASYGACSAAASVMPASEVTRLVNDPRHDAYVLDPGPPDSA